MLEGKIQTEDSRYVRDLNSKALLSTDLEALKRHRSERASQTARNVTLKFLMDTIDNEVSSCKRRLSALEEGVGDLLLRVSKLENSAQKNCL